MRGAIKQAAEERTPRTSFSGHDDQICIQSVEWGVFVLSSWRSTTALVMLWAVLSAHDAERLGMRCRLPS